MQMNLQNRNIIVCVLGAQSCLTLYNHVDCRPPDSSVHGILQARILEWLSFPSPSCVATAAKSLQSCPTLCDPIDGSPSGSPVPRILQEEHWSGLSFPSAMYESEK